MTTNKLELEAAVASHISQTLLAKCLISATIQTLAQLQAT